MPTKSPHVRCRSTLHRLALNAAGALVEFTGNGETRVVRGANGVWVANPTQAQLEEMLGGEPGEEIVLPREFRSPRAVRHAAAIAAGTRTLDDFGAYRSTVHPSTITDSRGVRQMLAARAKLGAADVNVATPELTRRPSEAVGFAALQDTDAAALAVYGHRGTLAAALRTPSGDTPAWKDDLVMFTRAVHPSNTLGGDGSAAASVGRLICSAAPHGAQATRDALRCVAVAWQGQELRTTAFTNALSRSGIDPGRFIYAGELTCLYKAGAFNDPRISTLSNEKFVAVAGMVERGWDPSDAIDLLDDLEANADELTDIAAWAVCDNPDTTRRGLAEQAAAGDRATLRRWIGHRGNIPTLEADLLLDELGKLHPGDIQQLASALSANALSAAASWVRDDASTWSGAGAAMLSTAAVFGKRTGQWRAKMEKIGVNLHDASHWLPAPQAMDRKDRDTLGAYLLEHAGRSGRIDSVSDLRSAATLWPKLTADERKMKPSALARRLVARGYGPASETPFGHAAAALRVPPDLGAEAAGVWAKGLGQVSWTPVGSRRVGSLKVEFLPRSDANGLFLGELTDCCQSIGGFGDRCARHGQGEPDGAFCVVRDREGRIVAQAWCWLDKKGRGVCFDNVERLTSGNDAGRRVAVGEAITEAANWLVSEGHQAVHIGEQMTGIDVNWMPKAKDMKPSGYNGYTDADAGQRLVAGGDGTMSLRRPKGDSGLVAEFGENTTMRIERDADHTLAAIHVTDIDGPVDEAATWLASRGTPVVVDADGPAAAALTQRLAALGTASTPRDLSPLLGELTNAVRDPGDVDVSVAVARECRDGAEPVPEELYHDYGYDEEDEWDDYDRRDYYDYYDYDTESWGTTASNDTLADVRARWASLRRFQPDAVLFDEPSDVIGDLERQLCDIDLDGPWTNEELLGPHSSETTYNAQAEVGHESLEEASVYAAGIHPAYSEIGDALFGPAGTDQLHSAGVPLKAMYLLGQCGWTSSQVRSVWSSSLVYLPRSEAAATLSLIAEHRIDESEVKPFLRLDFDSTTAVEMAIDAKIHESANGRTIVVEPLAMEGSERVAKLKVGPGEQAALDEWYAIEPVLTAR